jgi:FMN phosphatase YigB (HAD superfamily)
MKQLKLGRGLVFIDWHGVMSDEPFWSSILSDSLHPARDLVQAEVSKVFSNQGTTRNWMVGHLRADDIVANMQLPENGRYGRKYLLKRLAADCKNMQIDTELLTALRKLAAFVPVVLATDNMDCFASAISKARSKRTKWKEESTSLHNWASLFDDFVCSSDIGALKAENPKRFFGPMLRAYAVDFADALLIDDRADNCAAFEQAGGYAIRWHRHEDSLENLRGRIETWLERVS